jgi:peroxiredoxin
MSISNSAADPVVPGSHEGPRAVDDRSGSAAKSSSLLFWGGALAAVALLPIFFLQAFWAKALFTPWYLPIGGTIAALVVIYALSRGWRWWKVAIAAVCVMLAGLEWLFLLGLTVLPQYDGPVAAGSPLPGFHATWADGSTFDESSFQQNRPTALVFFQGRWCPFCMTQLQELESHHADFAQAGADVVVVSIEDVETAAQTQRDFPHLKVASDEQRELSNAMQLVNKASAPDGSDTAAPTVLILDGAGKVQWLHRPTRIITRPSAAELLARLPKPGDPSQGK